jgi:Big-like domain-containing protein
MNHRRLSSLVVLAFIAACGGDEPTPPPDTGPTVVSVTVSPASPAIEIGETQQMSAIANSATGGSISGQTVAWTSSDESVATITSAGLATGTGEGATAITATVAGVAGSQVMTVEPDECEQATTVSLAAGEFAAYPAGECLLLPSGASGDYYRVVITRPTTVENASNVSDATLTVTGLGTLQNSAAQAAAPASARQALGPRIDGSRLLENDALKESTARFHMNMLEREIRERGPGPDGVAPDRKPFGLRLLAEPPDRLELSSGFSCSAPDLPQTLVNFNDDLAIYQDSTQRATTPISASATQEMLDYYTAYVKDMIPQYWGDVSDIDGNGRIIVTTSPALGDTVAAAVFTGDLRTNGSCANGNVAEVVFFNVELITDLDGADPNWLALATMAHEIKHLVSIRQRYDAGTGIPPIWIEEGMAEISAVMSSRIAWAATGGPALGEAVTQTNLLATLCATDPCGFTKEIFGVVDVIANAIIWTSTQPNSLITNPDGAHEFHSFYAAAWHFHRFLGDAFGGASAPMGDAPLFKNFVASTSPLGVAALEQFTGQTFDQLFQSMAVAMALHKTSAPAPVRGFTTYDFTTSMNIFTAPDVLSPDGVYPWPVTTVGSDLSAGFTSAVFEGQMGPAGLRFHDFESNGSGTGAQIEVEVGAPAEVLVVRIR